MYLSSRARDEYISAVGHGMNISQLRGQYHAAGSGMNVYPAEGPGMTISQWDQG